MLPFVTIAIFTSSIVVPPDRDPQHGRLRPDLTDRRAAETLRSSPRACGLVIRWPGNGSVAICGAGKQETGGRAVRSSIRRAGGCRSAEQAAAGRKVVRDVGATVRLRSYSPR